MTTLDLVEEAVEVARTLMAEGSSSTVALLDDSSTRHMFVQPGDPTATWEAECAMDAAGATRAALVMPITTGGDELLHILGIDLDWGIDVHRVRFVRTAEGVAFCPVETCRTRLRLRDDSPGYVLIQAMNAFRQEAAA